MKYLNEEEQELIESVEQGEWHSVGHLEEAIREAQGMASETTRKDARMNIRISGQDLRALKARALEEGLPYQTLVSSILHKYVHGKLVEPEKHENSS
ncbi:MAG TPA: antitoxin [bacterium]|nr:antitoxin [bacterium]